MKKVKGCTHLIIKRGKIAKVVTHLNKIPKEGVIHLKGDEIYTINEFKKNHPKDSEELKVGKSKIIIGEF